MGDFLFVLVRNWLPVEGDFFMARVWRVDALSSGRHDDVKQATARAKAIGQSLRLRLCSGLRQSGGRFAAKPALPRCGCNHEGCGLALSSHALRDQACSGWAAGICGELRKAVVLRTMPTHAMRLHEWGTRRRALGRFALWLTRQDVPLSVLRARRVMVLPLKSVPANNRESRPSRKSGL